MNDIYTNKILIVDDNFQNVQVLGSLLEREGYHTEFALSGIDALDWVNDEVFDLILLDIMMPEMDGFEVCTIIRKNEKYNDVPILFLTAKTDIYSTLKAFNVKAQDYISKPFDHDELIARIKTQLDLKESKTQLKAINSVLEEKVKDRTKELSMLLKELEIANVKLENANKDLKQLDDAKNRFIHLISHEMRTPLNGIVGSTEILKSLIQDEDLMISIDLLDNSVKRLQQFSLDAILLTSLKLQNYTIQYEDVNLYSVIEQLILKYESDLVSRNINLKLEGFSSKGQNYYTDKNLTFEVLNRLIENAIEYTHDNSDITIAKIKDNGWLEIVIKDSGNGFSDEMLSRELSLFNPVNGHVDQNIGLDLYLVEMIMKTLKGNFVFGNNEDNGAFVIVKFPI